MVDWTGGIVVFLAVIVLFLYRLFTDNNARFFNPRPFIAEDREKWQEFDRTNFVVFALALACLYFLVRFIRWVWMHS